MTYLEGDSRLNRPAVTSRLVLKHPLPDVSSAAEARARYKALKAAAKLRASPATISAPTTALPMPGRPILSLSLSEGSIPAAILTLKDARVNSETWTCSEIVAAVSKSAGVSLKEIAGDRRASRIVLARQAAAWLISKNTKFSSVQIGYRLGRDHSTVLHAVRMVEHNPEKFAKIIDGAKAILKLS